MSSQVAAQLNVQLGADTSGLVAGMVTAEQSVTKLKGVVKREMAMAEKASQSLAHATTDYGKVVSKVTQLERELSTGRLKNLGSDQSAPAMAAKARLLEQAKGYDAVATASMKAAGGMTAFQKQGLMYQTTDLFTQMASGQNMLVALIQQGGQLKDQMGGFGNMFRMLGSIITPFRVLMAGATAAVGAFALAAYQGSEESKRLRDDLILTGGFAGVTAGQIWALADSVAESTKTTVGGTKDILGALVASGQFSKESLSSATKAVAQFAKISGLSAKDAAEKLIPSLDGTAASAAKLNRQYHFLTFEQYLSIQAMERAGKVQEAIVLQSDALSASLANTKRELGALEKVWDALGIAASKTWAAMLNIGKPTAPEDVVKNTRKAMLSAIDIWTKFDDAPNRKLRDDAIADYKAALEKLAVIDKEAADKAEKAKVELKKITNEEKYGGPVKRAQKAEDVEKASSDSAYAKTAQTASEIGRLELDYERKKNIAISEEKKKNVEENNTFTVQNASILSDKLITLDIEHAEAVKKIRDKNYLANMSQMEAEAQERANAIAAQADVYKGLLRQSEFSREALEYENEKVRFTQANLHLLDKELQIGQMRLETERLIKQIKDAGGPEDEVAKLVSLEREKLLHKEIGVELADKLKKTSEIYGSVFSNMETALENFVRTGKLNFKDFTRSVIQDLLLIQMRAQMTGLFKLAIAAFTGTPSDMTNSMTGADILGRRASGGPVANDGSYIVGEEGPELFVPRTAGTIIPNHQLGGASSTTNITNNYINAIDTKSFEDRLYGSSGAIWAANQYAGKSLSTTRGRA